MEIIPYSIQVVLQQETKSCSLTSICFLELLKNLRECFLDPFDEKNDSVHRRRRGFGGVFDHRGTRTRLEVNTEHFKNCFAKKEQRSRSSPSR